MSKADERCGWSHWAIEYHKGDFSYVDWDTMAPMRAGAWGKWTQALEGMSQRGQDDELKRRRNGYYRAVKVAAHKVSP
jgi:hypothetical protein